MPVISEIARDIFRISIFAQRGNLQFNHFLVKDDEPLLYHTGLRGMHAEIRDAVSKLINVSELRHIGFSHFESDEVRLAQRVAGRCAQCRCDLRRAWCPCERERLHRPRGTRPPLLRMLRSSIHPEAFGWSSVCPARWPSRS